MSFSAHSLPSEHSSGIGKPDAGSELSEREATILRAIVHNFILMASPVGSRFLSKYLAAAQKLSPATIRNVMSDLEEMGFITHPHTSAGRMPTDKGYRYYVDSMMRAETLTEEERLKVHENLYAAPKEALLRNASKILGSLSHCLGVVEIPQISNAIVEKIELIPLSSNRLLVVVSLSSDIVRAISLEADFEVNAGELDMIARQLNERISGRPLQLVRRNLREFISDVRPGHLLVRLFVDSAEKLFTEHIQPGDKVHIAGTQNLFRHPEFESAEHFRSIIELIESEEIIIHLLDNSDPPEGKVNVLIGGEMASSLMQEYSLLTTRYRLTSAVGTIGIIGPKRMNYSKMISIINHVAFVLSHME